MSHALTKEERLFLAKVMDRKEKPQELMILSSEKENFSGDKSIPEPIDVTANSTMNTKGYNACAMLISTCQRMIQKSITDAEKNRQS